MKETSHQINIGDLFVPSSSAPSAARLASRIYGSVVGYISGISMPRSTDSTSEDYTITWFDEHKLAKRHKYWSLDTLRSWIRNNTYRYYPVIK